MNQMLSQNDNSKCLIIAEVAQAHDGSLGMAHAYIDAIADMGADAVKFQTHIAHAESSEDEPWRVKFSLQDITRYDYWKRMEFTEDQWVGLKQHADDRGLLFLSSPFSFEAVELLERVGVWAWKVASGEVSNLPLLKRMTISRLPMILSSGMSSISELDEAAKLILGQNLPLTVLQCTTAYPCPPERVGLNMLAVFKDRYNCAVGLSDHSGTIYPGLAAATLGAKMIEVHVTFDKQMFGPDVKASITIQELGQLVKGIDFLDQMLNNPVDKDTLSVEFSPLRQMFTKSVVASSDLPAGTILQPHHLKFKKPGTGIPAKDIDSVLGRQLKRSIKTGQRLSSEDLA
jgi:N-acetylneuraminate synthase